MSATTNIAAWIEANLLDPDGRPIKLQPYQWTILERWLGRRSLVLLTPREPDRDKTVLTAALMLCREFHLAQPR